jgi:hypothetical protein
MPVSYERYRVQSDPGHLTISLVQGRQAVGMGVFSCGLIGVLWFFGPFGPKPLEEITSGVYWVASGFLVLVAVASAVALFFREEVSLGPSSIELRSTFRKPFHMSWPDALNARVEMASKQARTRGTRISPYNLLLLKPNGEASPIQFSFQDKAKFVQFVRALESQVQLNVIETTEEDAHSRRVLPGGLNDLR